MRIGLRGPARPVRQNRCPKPAAFSRNSADLVNPRNNRVMSYRRLAEALLEGRPYFGPAMRSLQGLATRHKYILPVVRKFARRSRIEILAVGSWAGASAISWASALKRSGIRGHVTCVDPWLPYFDVENEQISVAHYERMNDAAHAGAIRKLFEHNVACAGFCDVIVAREG